MKRLRFESLELLSRHERRARKLTFHPHLTVIIGPNDVGKSSIIKSLYWAFGAPPAVLHPAWASANIKALVKFEIDGKSYRILRSNDTFGIFNGDGDLIYSTSKVTKGLGPFLGELLDFKLVFLSRGGEAETPPPAYAFLPFYIDQDGGWTETLASFAKLAQYPAFRKPLIEFHTGILPNEYYELEAEKRRLQNTQREFEADRRIIRKAIERFDFEATFDGLELSVDGHEKSIEKLLERLTHLREIRQDRAKEISELLDQKIILQQQIRMVSESISELEKDAKFASDLPEEIYCPTCGTEHHNDFARRYSVVEDRELCFDFIAEAKQKAAEMKIQAARAATDLAGTDKVIESIQGILNEKKEDVTLFEVIESRGRYIAAGLFDIQLAELSHRVSELSIQLEAVDERLSGLKDAKRRAEIVDYYAGFVVDYLRRLDVTNYHHEALTKIPAVISETGSDLPRALLAYFLATLRTIDKYSTSLFAPIVIDSPNQQDQDEINVGSMIDLIISECPDGAQIILGTVSLHGRSIDHGKIIEFNEKLSVLRASEYDEVSESMRAYISKLIS